MSFQSLQVWTKSKELAVRIYKESIKSKEFKVDFSFRDQIRRAAVSVPSNIAEGYEMGTNKHSIHHFNVAKGSCAELITQIIIAQNIGYLTDQVAHDLIDDANHALAMLKNLIRSRKKYL